MLHNIYADRKMCQDIMAHDESESERGSGCQAGCRSSPLRQPEGRLGVCLSAKAVCKRYVREQIVMLRN